MVRTRFSATSLESPPFQDRQAQLHQITGHVEALHEDPRHFKVLEVLGLGGMGKTSLLEELWTRALEARSPDHLLWVSLEGEGSTNATGPLLAMRDQLAIECLLFDTALLAYWNATGQPLQLARSSRLAESLPVKALELSGGASSQASRRAVGTAAPLPGLRPEAADRAERRMVPSVLRRLRPAASLHTPGKRSMDAGVHRNP
jgi:hypothetical protein